MSDPEMIAGERYRTTSQIIRSGSAVKALANHIKWMLGENEWHRPVWRGRKIPPDGKTFETATFKDYLLLPSREGLDLPSLLTVHKLCEADAKHGAAAISMMRREIGEDYDRIIEREKRAVVGTTRTAGDAKGGRPKKGTNIVPLSKGGTDRLVSRLKRDHPEIAAAVERGEYPSIRAAAIAAGIIKPPDHLATLKRHWDKATPEQRAAFLDHINHGS